MVPVAADQTQEDGGFCSFLRRRINLNVLGMAAAEMTGTFILMFSVAGIIASTKLSRGEVGLLEYAFTGGFAVVLIMFSAGQISGAHVNPSVTIAFSVLGYFPWSKMVGSMLGTYVGKIVYDMEADFANTKPLQGTTTAFFAELMATFMLMFLAASLSDHAPTVGHLSPFIVGAAISLAILITAPVSGGSMNPARSFGPAVVSLTFDSIWVYIMAPTIGAIAGAFLYRILRYHHVTQTAFISNVAQLTI